MRHALSRIGGQDARPTNPNVMEFFGPKRGRAARVSHSDGFLPAVKSEAFGCAHTFEDAKTFVALHALFAYLGEQ